MSSTAKIVGLAAALALTVSYQPPAHGQDHVAVPQPADSPAQQLTDVSRGGGPQLTSIDEYGHWAHLQPTVQMAHAMATDNGPLLYHAGGAIMPRLNIYSIFWKPAKLQNGSPANMAAGYTNILTNLAADYVGHSIASINTQYYQTIGGVTSFVTDLVGSVAGSGSDAASYLDTQPYPASGCTDTATPGNCMTDPQMQTELLRVMKATGLTGGMDKVYILYTASGEGSCHGTSCAYTGYCGYHSHIAGAVPILYAIIPYGVPADCDSSGYYPNGNPAADSAAGSVSHEVTEAVTDPLGNAWFSAQGSEIGDLCAYNYGLNLYDGGGANQWWNGHFYEIQREYDNHLYYNGYVPCSQAGP